ncbi:NAD(P)-binding protein [Cryobacterium sp. CG_9.6]|uniref:NAD(P)/FAD-dependent oxidoreductase n=1 Tax=Cryobacterium sp. CG_9.6 TaxID=2760710 RepID=UPI00247380DF|nr:NAD(P)-binding protein [Cryobacterium sp. CG_9.6]MDH6237085.1 putative NAD/FAD-dependent oxidoreductase [Cryobacterium sp. CG_9.6]
MQQPQVLIIGAGISGMACAQALKSAGIPARVVDRGRRPGGRMTSRTINSRTVDLGASYFTAEPGTPFADVVSDWVARGLARPWTDTVAVAGADGINRVSTGPMRYAAPAGLQRLVADLGHDLDIHQGVTIEHVTAGEADTERYDTVVLAMPDPQARRLLTVGSALHTELNDDANWEPSIAVVLEWAARDWESFHTAFVNDVAEITTLADDGDRRGDDAPVLVAHTTAALARQHLDDPDGAITSVTAAVRRLLSLSDAPTRAFAHRWTFARPAAQHPQPYWLSDRIGVCGDAWGQRSSVATAWASGDALGRTIAAGGDADAR